MVSGNLFLLWMIMLRLVAMAILYNNICHGHCGWKTFPSPFCFALISIWNITTKMQRLQQLCAWSFLLEEVFKQFSFIHSFFSTFFLVKKNCVISDCVWIKVLATLLFLFVCGDTNEDVIVCVYLSCVVHCEFHPMTCWALWSRTPICWGSIWFVIFLFGDNYFM